jgi:hypothetical protein
MVHRFLDRLLDIGHPRLSDILGSGPLAVTLPRQPGRKATNVL